MTPAGDPFQPQVEVFLGSRGDISYERYGDPKNPVVVLLHGFPFSRSQWMTVTPVLAARFNLIVPDLPGSGASHDVAPDGGPVLTQQADAISELLAALQTEIYAVVGHSMGAAVGLLLASGEGAAPAPSAMVLMDSIGLDADFPARELADELGEHDATEALIAGLDGRPLDAVAGIRETLASLDMPVLLFWGEEDLVTPMAVAEGLNDAIVSSALGVLPGCGHLLIRDAGPTVIPMFSEWLRARYLNTPHGHEDAGIVTIQLERRPAWVDLEEYEKDDWFDVEDDDEKAATDAEAGAGQEPKQEGTL